MREVFRFARETERRRVVRGFEREGRFETKTVERLFQVISRHSVRRLVLIERSFEEEEGKREREREH